MGALIFALLLGTSSCFGQLLVGQTLFINSATAPLLSANPDLLNSTSNDYGPWGAPEFLFSFTNDYGPVGSPDFLTGVSNDYGTGLRLRLVEPILEPIQMSFEILEGY